MSSIQLPLPAGPRHRNQQLFSDYYLDTCCPNAATGRCCPPQPRQPRRRSRRSSPASRRARTRRRPSTSWCGPILASAGPHLRGAGPARHAAGHQEARLHPLSGYQCAERQQGHGARRGAAGRGRAGRGRGQVLGPAAGRHAPGEGRPLQQPQPLLPDRVLHAAQRRDVGHPDQRPAVAARITGTPATSSIATTRSICRRCWRARIRTPSSTSTPSSAARRSIPARWR